VTVTRAHGTLGSALEQLAGLVDPPDLAAVNELQRRLSAGRLRVLVVGEAKRGKSTLVNALLGRPVLPTGVLPLTALTTTLAHGTPERVIVELSDGRRETHPLTSLPDWVTETGNPGNRREVRAVTVYLDAPLLATGVELVDTPGTGSVHEHNTAEARDALDRMDVAVFVVSADPPISASERAWLRAVRVQAVRVLCVLNKADYLSAPELDQAVAFTGRVVADELGESAPVWPVSAARAVSGRSDPAWTAFSVALSALLRERGTHDLHRSVRQRAHRLAVAASASATSAALALDEQDMNDRLRAFEDRLAQVEADRFATLAFVRARVEQMRAETDRQAVTLPAAVAGSVLSAATGTVRAGTGSGRQVEDAALAAAAAAITGAVDGWRTGRAREIDEAVQQLERDARTRLDDHVAAVRAAAVDLFDVELDVPPPPTALRDPAKFWYSFSETPGQTTLMAGAVRHRLPGQLGHRHVERYVRRRVCELLDQQTGRARADLDQRLRETQRQLTTALEQHFDTGAGRIRLGLHRAAELRRTAAGQLQEAREGSQKRRTAALHLAMELAGGHCEGGDAA
jgi:GTP-binding protein EngB required for normal cell division